MWGNLGNIGNVVGAAIQKVKTLQNELEASMDAAVGVEHDKVDLKGDLTAPLSGVNAVDSVINTSTNSNTNPLVAGGSVTQVSHGESELRIESPITTLSAMNDNSSHDSIRIDTPVISITSSAADAEAFKSLQSSYDALSREIVSERAQWKKQLEAEREKIRATAADSLTNALEVERQKSEKEFQAKQEGWDQEKATLSKRVEDIKAKAKEKRLELTQKMDQKIKAVEENAESKVGELKKIIEQLEERNKDLGLSLSQHEQQCQRLQLELNQSQVTVQQQQQQLNMLQQAEDARVASAAIGTTSSGEDNDSERQEALRAVSLFQERIASLTSDLATAQQASLETAQRLVVSEGKEKSLTLELEQSLCLAEQRRLTILMLEQNISQVTEELHALTARAQEEKDQLDANNEDSAAKISILETALEEAQNQLSAVNVALQQQVVIIASLEGQVSSAREVIADRERALETSTSKMSEIMRSLDDAQRKISDLTTEISEKDSRLRAGQNAAQSEVEYRKLISKLQDTIKEKEDRLSSFEVEGQSLSKKQGELEKAIRTSKKELKEKDQEIVKLKESKDQLVKAIEEMQEVMRKHESEATTANKSLGAMQAVTQATADKLSKLEAEVISRTDELNSQRRALEAAWADSNEQKRTIAELKAERDDLKRQIGEGTSKVLETESTRRDIEQREALLRATSKQLQDSLHRQMQEANGREERLREEANEMRKRWQEAITSRESLAAEMSTATAPLLKQIGHLQDTLRIKSETWQNIETNLTERALRAESAAEIAVHKKAIIEEQIQSFKQQIQTLTTQLSELQSNFQQSEMACDKAKRSEAALQDKVAELESRLSLESGQKQSLTSSLRELENRHRLELADARDAIDVAEKTATLKLSKLEREIESLRSNLQEEKKRATEMGQKRGDSSLSKPSLPAIDTSLDGSGGTPITTRLNYPVMPETLPSGEASFAALEKGHQQQQRKLDDIRAMQQQLHQLQLSRDALLEEVSYLSSKNAKLEEQLTEWPGLVEKLAATKKRVDVLLVMLGEKEEELEATIADMKEIKFLYRGQLDELLQRLAPGPNETSANASSRSSVLAPGPSLSLSQPQ